MNHIIAGMIQTNTLSTLNIVFMALSAIVVILSIFVKSRKYRPLSDTAYSILLICAFVLAVAIRSIAFSSVPGGVNQDEAMAAVDARALSQYGTDRLGMVLPVHFQAWGFGQMSVLLSYLMVPFIKMLGFSTLSIRLPMLLLSLIGLLFLYLLSKDLFDRDLALVILFFASICPWHIVQSRWSLDCNVFPHVLIISIYFMNHWLKNGKKIFLYLSMAFFGLSMYGYGVSIYIVPIFLLISCIYLIIIKMATIVDALICLLIYLFVSWPFFTMIILNTFGLDTIKTPLFTIPYFPSSLRKSDILFFCGDFSAQLHSNIICTLNVVFQIGDDYISNVVPGFSTMYKFSIPFGLYGFYWLIRNFRKSAGIALLNIFFFVGILSCLITSSVNVNRANVIMYPLMIMTGIGIYQVLKTVRFSKIGVSLLFAVAFTMFSYAYFTTYKDGISKVFYEDFGQAATDIQPEDYDKIFVTPDVQIKGAGYVSEVLTLYYHDVDSKYYQSSDFNKKYVFLNPSEDNIDSEGNNAYIFKAEDIDLFDSSKFEIKLFGGYATATSKGK